MGKAFLTRKGAALEELNITENGTFTAPAGKGYKKVVANVPVGTEVSGSVELTTNGPHDVSNFAEAIVNVPIPEGYVKPSGTKDITENGTYPVSEFENVTVNVAGSGGGSSGSLVGERKFVDVPAIDKITPSNDKQFFDLEATVALGNASGIIKKIWVFTTDETQIISFGYVGDIYIDGELMNEDLELPIYNLWNTTEGGDAWLYKELAEDVGMDITKDVLQTINITKQPADEIIASFLQVNTNAVGGTCSGKHVIEVDELPETGEDGAIYDLKLKFSDVILVLSADFVLSYSEALEGMGNFYYVPTKPTENIMVSSETDGYHLYYVEDEDDVFLYGDMAGAGTNAWVSFGAMLNGAEFKGYITDRSSATEEGYYAFGGTIKYFQYDYNNSTWNELLTPSGTLEVADAGTYNVKKYEKVKVALAANNAFPESTWSTGTAVATIEGTEYEFTYYYKTSAGDPKTIPLVKEIYHEDYGRTYTSSNLADFYFYTLIANTLTTGWHDHWWEYNTYDITDEEAALNVGVASNPVFIISTGGYDSISMLTGDVYNNLSIAVYTGNFSVSHRIIQWKGYSDSIRVTMCGSLPSGTLRIAENGQKIVVNDYAVDVDVPTYIASYSEDTLPMDAANGTIAFVLGGE